MYRHERQEVSQGKGLAGSCSRGDGHFSAGHRHGGLDAWESERGIPAEWSSRAFQTYNSMAWHGLAGLGWMYRRTAYSIRSASARRLRLSSTCDVARPGWLAQHAMKNPRRRARSQWDGWLEGRGVVVRALSGGTDSTARRSGILLGTEPPNARRLRRYLRMYLPYLG